MRQRLRPTPSDEELAKLYASAHQHEVWADHRVRVDVTVAMAGHMLKAGGTVVDLSCGDAAIAARLHDSHGAKLILGDYAPGYQYTGPIEKTVQSLRWQQADLFICCETLEHLDDPDMVLAAIREKTDRLVISTPDGETDDSNPEHVWGWDAQAVEAMLRAARFTPAMHTRLDLRPAGYMYCYQIWCAT